ncbi:A disintegrin and metalloproteinase with thrombospondin motifs adt-1 isoform X1 [Hydra vulgaris]|uniref:A disintegrin and metalloproteinase with thrombospondin motifs adt-1 isoform X1 n=1 Tax=Hydra vulgaris TaxID=6087 RepID=UPI001F5F8B03|nr:A disintegrin and metalloproteinase with thrombospondin motifs adt-1-like isoform X1 [Hydra vulgaris]
MAWRIVFLLTAGFVYAYAAKPPVTCQRSFSKIGCFKEVNSRPDLALNPMKLEINDRDPSSSKYQGYLIDWKNMEASVHSLACRCASAARSLKMNYFSLRFWGECWVGKTDMGKLVITLRDPKWVSTDCVNSWSFLGVCDHKHEKECVAKAGSGYIYFLDDTSKSEENIDGAYSEWSSYTECSATCGFGLMERERTCTNPAPVGKGKDCSSLGPMSDEKPCNLRECPVNGGISEWTDFGPCSKSCGGGISVRTRSCTNPSPLNGGKDCSESIQESKDCSTDPCPIDGNYGLWNAWGTCSADCGDGFQTRQRECNNPKPQNGGKSCELAGISQESRLCKLKDCPINGGFGSWSEFSPCSKLCGDGIQTRTRKCDQPEPAHGGKDCEGTSVETNMCKIVDCPIDGKYGQWNSWGTCSVNCGTGVQTRQRECNSPKPEYGGKSCELTGFSEDSRTCKIKECPINGKWSEWESFGACTQTCGSALRSRKRSCNNPKPEYGGQTCDGSDIMTESCSFIPCPVNGGLSEWTVFGPCSKSCGGGISVRTRTCTNPSPSNGGKDCSEPTLESKICSSDPCPIDGNFGEWNSWGTCSVDCGTGVQTRQRECNSPKPQYGGKTCDLIGITQEQRECKLKECPINGGFGSWSEFSACSKLCGDGVQTRTRKCDQPEPAYGGKDCVGTTVETNFCKIVDCPIDGSWSEWEPFSECSQSCGSTLKSRKRSCTNPAPQYGGKACEGLDTMTTACPFVPCPVNGGYGQWSSYSSCSKDCGQGTRTRTRQCDSPSPANGGRNCDVFGPSSEQINCYTQCPTQSAIACEAEDLNINCYGRGTIQISSANYGRRADHICTRWPNRWNRNCGNEWNSRNVVTSRCQNQAACSVRAGNEVFGDPCWGIYKYLEVQYYCSG